MQKKCKLGLLLHAQGLGEGLILIKVILFPCPKSYGTSSLLLSPHVFLLGIFFACNAFKAPNLTLPDMLGRLDIHPDE